MSDITNNLPYDRGAPLNFPDNNAVDLIYISTDTSVSPQIYNLSIPQSGYSKLSFNGRTIFSSAVLYTATTQSYFTTLPIKTFLIKTPKHNPLFCVFIDKIHLQGIKDEQVLTLFMDFQINNTNPLRDLGRWYTLDDNFKKNGGGYTFGIMPYNEVPVNITDLTVDFLITFEEREFAWHTSPLIQAQFRGHFFWCCPCYPI